MSSDPPSKSEDEINEDSPSTLPTGMIPMGVTLATIPRCVHNGNPDLCGFCKADQELVERPELLVTMHREHEFGCPLFVNEKWTDIERRNYERIYGEGSGRTECTCKKEMER